MSVPCTCMCPYAGMQITATMSKFEDLFEDLDTHTQVIDSAMSTATTLNTPEDQVEGLMRQVRVCVCLGGQVGVHMCVCVCLGG